MFKLLLLLQRMNFLSKMYHDIEYKLIYFHYNKNLNVFFIIVAVQRYKLIIIFITVH